jgi:hypothetical protein
MISAVLSAEPTIGTARFDRRRMDDQNRDVDFL